jgi:FG-GAP repeat
VTTRKGLLILALLVSIGKGGDTGANAASRATPSGSRVVVRQQLEPTGGTVHGGLFGSGIAISGDGRTLLVGAPGNGSSGGAVWAFARLSSGWSRQGRPVVTSGPRPACLGTSVALSSAGTTALVGDPCFDGNRGAAWVFVRSGSTWKQLGPRLVGRAGEGGANFGAAVALSATGNVALIGGPDDDRNAGAAWVFRRDGSKWRQEGQKLRGRGEVGGGQLGQSVALSANGTIALLGGPSDDNSKGTAWVFARSGPGWRQQGTKLTAKGGAANAQFGFSVALSGSGRIALVGSPSAGEWGQAMLFAGANGVWSEQGRLALDGKGAYGLTGGYGVSVALSATGNTALVGSGLHNTDAAAAMLFTRSGATWASRGLTLATPRAITEVTVALSSTGTMPVVGSPSAFSNAGAAWAFSFLNVTPPTFSRAPRPPGKKSGTGPLAA